ncbi:MAG: single-stranded-DNA-specific exonuclease RecJ [Oscillospiraceae bacterium]|nr:single-stranded-DNA-specific exonuclease RecJ [Oscillospiraceae bacterium]
MKYKTWKTAAPDLQGRAALEREGVHPLVAAVLSARGLRSVEQAREFLRAEDNPLCDPFDMKDMDRAAARVRLALERGEKIAVYGDYDVDGITSTCLLTHLLTDMGGQVTPYIPDRLEEGYGLNCDAVSALVDNGVRLIITVDCGITAVDEVAWANSIGADVVVTDHHECKAELPCAYAVVDPHRPDCPYPFKGLAGVGVALKLAMALAGPEKAQRVLDEYADLAAIGTVADVMPMVGENRTIVQRGLRSFAALGRVGLAMLVREAGMENRPLNSVSIGYALAPRINAAGRMGCAGVAVELLLTRDADRAAQLARELCRLNRERQSVELGIFEQCTHMLEQQPQKDAIVLADSSWHQGVVGIVASRLTEQYGCPAFMICLSGGMGKGSCRSYGGINLFAVLEGCQDLLEAFGGHELAAGFTVREENIPALTQRIAQQVRRQAGGIREPELEVDVEVDDPRILDLKGVELLEQLEPYGTGNPRPVLSLTGAQVMSHALVGNGRHLKLKLGKAGVTLDAIFFSAGDWQPQPGSRVDAAFYPQINEYRGMRMVQLHLVDARPAPSRAQYERELYEKYRRREALTCAQVHRLIPGREQFVVLWRYLKQQTDRYHTVEDTAAHIARAAARAAGSTESVLHTLICLDVLQERGLIAMSAQGDRLRICLNPTQGKVDLEQSEILRRLRGMLCD